MARYIHVPVFGCIKNTQTILIKDREKSIEQLWSIGGDNGWYYLNSAWRIRGFIDKCFGGVGLRRGRTHPTNINPGDALDFWRVIYANSTEDRLLLYAETKLPGTAWLEWRLSPKNDRLYLIQEATFRPRGIMGRLYWYALFIPDHFIFRGLAKCIAEPKPARRIS